MNAYLTSFNCRVTDSISRLKPLSDTVHYTVHVYLTLLNLLDARVPKLPKSVTNHASLCNSMCLLGRQERI